MEWQTLSKRKQRNHIVFLCMLPLAHKLHKHTIAVWEKGTKGEHAQAQGVGAGARKAMYACGYTHKEHREMEKSLAFSGATIPNSRVSNTDATHLIQIKAAQLQRTKEKMRGKTE